MDRNVLQEYVASADDVHMKYFHRRQPPTTAGLPGIDYDSAINVHICHNGVPGRASGYVPSMAAAYENQA